MKRVDRFIGIGLLVFGLAAAYESLKLGLERSGLPGAGLFPLMASFGIVLLAVLQIVQSRRNLPGEPFSWPSAESLKKTGTFAAGLLLYVFLTGTLGFFISTLLFLGVLIHFPGGYGWRTTLTISAIFSTVLYMGLIRLLGVPVPQGILGAVGL